jgi:hypothetical protein
VKVQSLNGRWSEWPIGAIPVGVGWLAVQVSAKDMQVLGTQPQYLYEHIFPRLTTPARPAKDPVQLKLEL